MPKYIIQGCQVGYINFYLEIEADTEDEALEEFDSLAQETLGDPEWETQELSVSEVKA